MPEIQQARPPFVQFELRAVEDRNASIEQGYYVAKDVAFAIITPAGSKDKTEKLAEEWLANMRYEVQQERLPLEWFNHYKNLYSAWKEGREAPETGTSIRNWPVASPAQIEILLNLRIRTVEDLAAANEEAISRMGMGGRLLKQKAVDWLSSAASHGKGVEAAANLRAENDRLKLDIERLTSTVAALERKILSMAGGSDAQSPVEDDDGDIQLNVTPLPAVGGARRI